MKRHVFGALALLLVVTLVLSVAIPLDAATPTASASPAATGGTATPGSTRGAPPTVAATNAATAAAPTRGAPPSVDPTATPTATGTATATAPAATAPASIATGTCSPTTPTNSALAQAAANGKEVVGLRTRSSRTFVPKAHTAAHGKAATGSTAIIAAGALNFRDAQGAWQPIDPTLVPATANGYALQNKAAGFRVALPADLGTNPVQISAGTLSLSLALVGAHGTPTPCGTAGATYAGALPGVDVTERSGVAGVQELPIPARRGPSSTASARAG